MPTCRPMCGRYYLTAEPDAPADFYDSIGGCFYRAAGLSRYKIAPGQLVPVVAAKRRT